MVDHIKVDYATLGATADALRGISVGLRASAGGAGTGVEVLGHPALVGAMEDFTGNWRIHREQLISSVDGHEKLVRAALEGHQALDKALAGALTGEGKNSSGAAGRAK